MTGRLLFFLFFAVPLIAVVNLELELNLDGGIRLFGFILAGFMASKNADLLYFGGPWTDYQCHSETTSNQPHYQFEVQFLGLGPCGFPSFFYFDVQYEVLFRVLLIMTTVIHPDKARM